MVESTVGKYDIKCGDDVGGGVVAVLAAVAAMVAVLTPVFAAVMAEPVVTQVSA